jgi:hypothetical protein
VGRLAVAAAQDFVDEEECYGFRDDAEQASRGAL